MKILVTGGVGFIGSNVVDGYVAAGHDVAVVDNLYTGKLENLNPAVRFHELDIRAEGLEEVFKRERPEIVNHHAAQMSVPASVKDPRFDADVNVLGFLNLLECSRKHGVRKVIFISSGGAVYGEASECPTSEGYAPRPLSPYAITKFVSEYYLRFYRVQYGMDYTVLRYANVYGPRQVPHGEAGVVAIFMDKLYRGELPTVFHYPEEPQGMTRDYCYVGDIVRANLMALEKGQQEVVNIGTGVETSTMELYRKILARLRESGVAADPSLDEPRRGSARAGDLRRSCLDVRRAERLLGWRPALGLEDGLRETVRWFLETKGAGSSG